MGKGGEVREERITSPASEAKPTNNGGALDSANRLVPFIHSLDPQMIKPP